MGEPDSGLGFGFGVGVDPPPPPGAIDGRPASTGTGNTDDSGGATSETAPDGASAPDSEASWEPRTCPGAAATWAAPTMGPRAWPTDADTIAVATTTATRPASAVRSRLRRPVN